MAGETKASETEAAERAELTELLVGTHRCHTVILYGSRARGDATSESDWDVAGVRPHGELFRIARPWRGTFLDVFVYAEENLRSPDDDLLKLRGGRLLVDEKGFGAELMRRLDVFHAAGPTPRPAWEVEMQRVWFQKTLARIRRGDVEAHLRRGWLLMDALEHWFRFRGRFYPGPKEGLAWLEHNDPMTFQLFAEALQPGAPLSAVERLVESLLG